MPVQYSERNLVTELRNPSRIAGFAIVILFSSFAAAQQPTNQQDYDIAQRKAVTAVRRIDGGLITPEVFANYNKHLKAYRSLLSSGANPRNQGEMETLRAGLKYRILVLSDSTVQGGGSAFGIAFSNVERDLSSAGNLIQNAIDKKSFRELVYRESLPLIKQLLQDNLLARSAGLELALEMEVVAPRGGARIEMFDQVDDLILSVLNDQTQPDAVKIRAANSAKRYLIKANAIPQIQNALAEALIAELNRPFAGVALQNAVLMALEYVTSPRQLVGERKPIVLEAVVNVMSDQTRELRLRCRAARVAGRTGYDAQVNFEPIAWKVAELTLETAARFSQDQNKDKPDWDFCGWYLYTAFHHENKQETQGRPPGEPKGFLNRDAKSEVIRSGYVTAVGPMGQMMFENSAVDVRQLTSLAKWTDKNIPSNMKFDQTCDEIKPAGR